MNSKMIMAVMVGLLSIGQLYAAPFTYSVKFICGLQRAFGNPPFELAVKPGNYATAINIHNYHNNAAVLARKVIVANGIISPVQTLALRPNQAISVSCTNIVRSIPSGVPPFVEGFAEIVSNVQLSVQAVYTSQGCKDSATGGSCTTLGELDTVVVPQKAFDDL